MSRLARFAARLLIGAPQRLVAPTSPAHLRARRHLPVMAIVCSRSLPPCRDPARASAWAASRARAGARAPTCHLARACHRLRWHPRPPRAAAIRSAPGQSRPRPLSCLRPSLLLSARRPGRERAGARAQIAIGGQLLPAQGWPLPSQRRAPPPSSRRSARSGAVEP